MEHTDRKRRAVEATVIAPCLECGHPVKQFPRGPGRPLLYCSKRCRNIASIRRYRNKKKAGTPSAHTGGSTPTEGERT